MKKILTLLAFILSVGVASAQDLPFKAGEKLDYVIEYKALFTADMVRVSLELSDFEDSHGGPGFHAVANISTFKFWDSFYRMRDTYETWFLANDTIPPVKFHRDAKEGKNYESEAFLDWNGDFSSVKVKIEKKGAPTRDTVYTEGVLLRDIINSLYLARILDYDAMLESGKPVEVRMTPYRDILQLRVRAAGCEELSSGKLGGRFKTVKLALAIQPKDVEGSGSGFKIGASEDGSYQDGEKIFLWVSDDENHIPVYFSAPASIGSIKGRLSSYTGLKYELTAFSKE